MSSGAGDQSVDLLPNSSFRLENLTVPVTLFNKNLTPAFVELPHVSGILKTSSTCPDLIVSDKFIEDKC